LDSQQMPVEIIRAEQLVLGELSRCGHPLAYLDKRRLLVDVAEKKVDALFVCKKAL